MGNNRLINLIESSELSAIQKVKSIYKNISLCQCNQDGMTKFETIIELCRHNGLVNDKFFLLSVLRDSYGDEAYYELATADEIDALQAVKVRFVDLQNQYLTTDDDATIIGQLIELSYELNEITMCYVLTSLYKKITDEDVEVGYLANKEVNSGFLTELLEDTNKKVVGIMQQSEEHLVNWDVLASLLQRSNHEMIILFEKHIEDDYEESILLQKSISQREEYGDITMYPYYTTNEINSLNITLEFIFEKHFFRDVALVVGVGSLLESIRYSYPNGYEYNKLSPFHSDRNEWKLGFGWIGDYVEYSSIIHKRDIAEDIEAPSEFDFSIVIPAKNTAKSLRYTLRTCLEQEYDGEYEIVISDNSEEGNNDVLELIKEINSPRIKYYKATRNYIISKSFESAILRARGRFIIPIGSDDGLFPWSLRALSKVLEENDEDIIMWERGQYQWPDYGQGISDRLYMPKGYRKEDYRVDHIDSLDYFLAAINNPDVMYNLPLLYINSGFKREYIDKVIRRTGRFMDGSCQDIYMGMINTGINSTIAVLHYPISIAGMTSASTGNVYEQSLSSADKVLKRIEQLSKISFIGGRVDSQHERLVPYATNAAGICYNCALRTISLGVFSTEIITNVIDWTNWYIHLVQSVKIDDLTYDNQINDILYSAQLHGQMFYASVEKMIEISAERQKSEEKTLSADRTATKSYICVDTEKGFVLDASNYKVEDIYGAVRLVAGMYDL